MTLSDEVREVVRREGVVARRDHPGLTGADHPEVVGAQVQEAIRSIRASRWR